MAAEREIKVRETAFADMASAVDVLGQQAGIDFVNEKIMIDGIYEATVYLDNRQINDLDQLRRLTASKIDNIKIIISPNAEYGSIQKAILKDGIMQTSVRLSLYIYNCFTDSISLAIITLLHARADNIMKELERGGQGMVDASFSNGLQYISHTFLGNIVFISYFCSVKVFV